MRHKLFFNSMILITLLTYCNSDKRPRDKTYTIFEGPDTDDSDVEASMKVSC